MCGDLHLGPDLACHGAGVRCVFRFVSDLLVIGRLCWCYGGNSLSYLNEQLGPTVRWPSSICDIVIAWHVVLRAC
jgi:hypothetical protein